MSFYQRYIIIFSLAMLLGLAIKPLFFFANLGYPNKAAYHLDGWVQVKDKYARTIAKPKVIFISGSNTLFGVDTERIEKEIGMPTVNYGVAIGLNFYILDRVKSHLKKEDVVILPLEYCFYEYSSDKRFESRDYVFYIIGYDNAFFYALPFSEKISCIQSVAIQDLIKLSWRRIRPVDTDYNEYYDRKYLNTNGDLTYNPVSKSMSENDLKKRCGKSVFHIAPLSNEAQKELSNFISYCQQNGIKVYAAWPNFYWTEKSFSGKDLGGINAIEEFYREHNVEILGNYTDCLYDAGLFYNSEYHLNEEGKRIHTDYLIRLLKEKLNR
ncbi:MAG: hypothetical protein SPL45_05370 [Schwartzia succinivorans]|nr:hypothetical protein [Schwartzia succinivorans]